MAVVGPAKERAVMREFREDKDERWYKRVFLVTVDDIKDDGPVVETAFGLPYAGQWYITDRSVDKNAKCISKSYNQIALLQWEVECEYSTKADSGGGTGTPEKPEFEDPVYVWSGTQIKEVITGRAEWDTWYKNQQDPSDDTVRIISEAGILNSAKEPYNPPAEIDRLIPTLTIERNETFFNHRYMLLYVNSVNKHKWFGWYPRCVKCASITGSLQVKIIKNRPYKYWKVQYVFHFNKYTWDLFLLDIGSYYLVGGSTMTPISKRPFMAKGVPSIGLLQANGDASSNSTLLSSINTPVARYNRYKVHSQLDFHMLGIPLII